MSLRDVIDALARSPAVRDTTIRLADPESPAATPAPEEGYFSVRLAQMRLSDERRWLHDITPAVFVIGEYDYNGTRVRKPCFVSNELLGPIVAGVDARKLRVNFANTLVIGPTPYAGGDVDLFVGLFQTVTEEHMTAMFGLFETVFGKIAGPAAAGIALAQQLLPAVLKCLGSGSIRCLLADRRPIGEQSLPASCYLAYLRGERGRSVDTAGLCIEDRQLMRVVDGAPVPVEDIDYCLIQVQCSPTRSDYRSLQFHKLWQTAMEQTGKKKYAQAQASMLECSGQVLASPDLTESHKIALLNMYQASLLAARTAIAGGSKAGAERGSSQLTGSGMAERVKDNAGFNPAWALERMSHINRLALKVQSLDPSDREIEHWLAQAPRGACAADTEALVRTLTLGSIAQ
jgi:hypothetical protein